MEILAGCSFIARMSKNFLERYKGLNISSESFTEFIEEKDKTDKIETNVDKNSTHMISVGNNPDTSSIYTI